MAPKKQKPQTWRERIDALKSRYGLTGAQLGERLGVSQQNVSDFRSGHRVPPKCVQKLISLMESGNPLENLG